MSNQRIANFAYIMLCFVVLIVVSQLMGQVWGYFNISDIQLVGHFGWPYVIAVAIAIPMFFVLKGRRTNDFVLEVISELREVTWPTRQDTTKKTLVVIVTVILLSLILGGFDFVWAQASKLLLKSI